MIIRSSEREAWSHLKSMQLPVGLGKEFFDGKARLLDPNSVRGVNDAVEKLNQGKVYCPENHCIVYSQSVKAYYVLFRNCSQADVVRRLGMDQSQISSVRQESSARAAPQQSYATSGSMRNPFDAGSVKNAYGGFLPKGESAWTVTSASITIVDGTFTRIFSNFDDTQDLYVKLFRISPDGREHLVATTETCEQVTYNARWNETIKYKRSNEDNTIKIAVYAKKKVFGFEAPHTFCGEAQFPLTGGQEQAIWQMAEQKFNQAQSPQDRIMSMPLKLIKKAETTGELRITLEPKGVQRSEPKPRPAEPVPSKGTDDGTGTASPDGTSGGQAPPELTKSLRQLLNRPDELDDKVRDIFRRVASQPRPGVPPCIGMQDMHRLAQALAEELAVAQNVFGDLKTLFLRFDFDCDDFIGETESVMMIKSMIMRYRDAVSPREGTLQLGEAVPYRKVESEYNLGKELGRGGQAIVHIATSKGSNREVVLKMYTKNDPDMPAEDITAEFELLITLKHPKIARYYDIFQDNVNFYIVSEPYYGGDLTKLVAAAHSKGVKVTELWLAKIILQIAQGVSFLHTNCIMHCDLKEANVMVADCKNYQNPQVVVIDFGLANHLSSTSSGGGSPGYMPPEVWEQGLWTPRGDVFSLGCVTFSLCFGQSPFLEGCRTIEDVRQMTLEAEPKLSWGSQSMRDTVNIMIDKKLTNRPAIKQVIHSQWLTEQIASTSSELHFSVLGKFAKKDRATGLRRALLADIASRENLAQLHELNDLFTELDTDNDGVLHSSEVKSALVTHGWPEDQVSKLLECLIGDDGTVSYEEFMVNLMTSTAADEAALMDRIFSEADRNGRGSLNLEDIAQLLKRPTVAKLLGKRTAADMLNDMDRDGDGLISLEEFKLAMHQVPKEKRNVPVGASTVRIAKETKKEEQKRQGYYVGQAIEYYSTSYSAWLPGKVDAYDSIADAVQVDNKPGWWLKGQELKKVRPRRDRSDGAAERTAESAAKAGIGKMLFTGAFEG